jgi:hypothetical protein
MPPATPIVEQVALAIVAAIEAIDGDAPWNVTVNRVLRTTRQSLTDGAELASLSHGDVLLVQGPRVRSDDSADGNPPASAWHQTWSLAVAVILSDSDETPVDSVSASFAADIERALMTDPQWNGLAMDTAIDEVVPLPLISATVSGAAISFTTLLRWQEDDPYTNRV